MPESRTTRYFGSQVQLQVGVYFCSPQLPNDLIIPRAAENANQGLRTDTTSHNRIAHITVQSDDIGTAHRRNHISMLREMPARLSVCQAHKNVLRWFYLNFYVVSLRHLTCKKHNMITLGLPSLQTVQEVHTYPTQELPHYSNTETLPRPPPTAFTLDPMSSGLPSDTMK